MFRNHSAMLFARIPCSLLVRLSQKEVCVSFRAKFISRLQMLITNVRGLSQNLGLIFTQWRRAISLTLVVVMVTNPVMAMPGMPTALADAGSEWMREAHFHWHSSGWAAAFSHST